MQTFCNLVIYLVNQHFIPHPNQISGFTPLYHVETVWRRNLTYACKLLCVELHVSCTAWIRFLSDLRIFGSLCVYVAYPYNMAAWFHATRLPTKLVDIGQHVKQLNRAHNYTHMVAFHISQWEHNLNVSISLSKYNSTVLMSEWTNCYVIYK